VPAGAAMKRELGVRRRSRTRKQQLAVDLQSVRHEWWHVLKVRTFRTCSIESGFHSIVLVALPPRLRTSSSPTLPFASTSECTKPPSDSSHNEGAACETPANILRCCRKVRPEDRGDVGDASAASRGDFMAMADVNQAFAQIGQRNSLAETALLRR
jgi:hypothetical protein